MDTFCSNCGRSLAVDDNFCPQCGKPTSTSVIGSDTSSNNPTIPALPFKGAFKLSSTDYGSNPYSVTSSNPYEISPLIPPPPPLYRKKKLGILIGIGLLVLILVNIGAWGFFIRGTQNNARTTLATATSISNSNGMLLYSRFAHFLGG